MIEERLATLEQIKREVLEQLEKVSCSREILECAKVYVEVNATSIRRYLRALWRKGIDITESLSLDPETSPEMRELMKYDSEHLGIHLKQMKNVVDDVRRKGDGWVASYEGR